MRPLVVMDKINKVNSGNTILSDAGLEVGEKDFFVLFGEDGAGKTELMHVLMGYDLDYTGISYILGEDSKKRTKEKFRHVRFVPDDILRMEGITGRQYLEMAQGCCVSYSKKLEEAMCNHFKVSLDEPLLTMTYCNNKLVQIIAAVAAEPKLLILDEPINFLDMNTYHRLLLFLSGWSKKLMSILLVTEKYEQADGLARHYAYMKEGRIVKADKAPEPDTITKVITLTGGRAAMLEPLLKSCIAKKNGRYTYTIQCSSESLMKMLSVCNCTNVIVEEMTLQEEIEEDYSRWI